MESYGRSRYSLSLSMLSFVVLSLIGSSTCTSEALASSSTFLPHAISTRGGSEGTRRPGSHSIALNSAPARLNGVNVNGDNGEEHLHLNGHSLRNGKSKKKTSKFSPPNVVRDNFEREAVPAEYIAETKLPTDIGHFVLRAYRIEKGDNEYVGNEPCVIYCPEKNPMDKNGRIAHNVPVRIHDQCVTSEVFRSQRCDCKEQLNLALKYIQENGGVIIYLQQEGRGIGIANKVAAYALQDIGLDTVDANLHLGFPEDARQYGVVPSILADMGIGSVKLMTNNPRKVARLSALGVEVVDTIPVVVPSNEYNVKYLQTKQKRMNHANFKDILSNNSAMIPKKPLMEQPNSIIAETYINDGEEMAANAVQVSLMPHELNVIVEEEEVETSSSQAGVKATENGYCFGRKSVEDAIQAISEGKMIVVVDDMDRENEGDLIMAADACTALDMAKIVRYSSGVICIAMEDYRMKELNLPAMVTDNQDPKGTAFSVTVDATKEHGITTGISAADRAKTVRLLADSKSVASDFARPGHIFPLRARPGGVLERDGHTEAAVDLSKLAKRGSAGILCEIVSEENPTEMARLPELKRFCKTHGFVLTSIVDIAQYRRDTEQ